MLELGFVALITRNRWSSFRRIHVAGCELWHRVEKVCDMVRSLSEDERARDCLEVALSGCGFFFNTCRANRGRDSLIASTQKAASGAALNVGKSCAK